MSTSGYEGSSKEEKAIPLPHLRKWRLPYSKVAEGKDGVVYVNVEVDGESIGFMRLPNAEHAIFVRERLSNL